MKIHKKSLLLFIFLMATNILLAQNENVPVDSLGKSDYSFWEGVYPAEPRVGAPKFLKAIYQELQYPDEARTLKIQGRIYIQCLIEKDGTVSKMEVIRGLGHGLDQEALRAIQKILDNPELGKLRPAFVGRGRPIRSNFVIPITFKLPDSEENSSYF